MKTLKLVVLTLVGALPLLPALATAQGGGLTIVGFEQRGNSHSYEGEDFEIWLVKDGPAAVTVIWTTGPPNLAQGKAATPHVDFTPSKGSVFFAADDTRKSFPIPILVDDDQHEPVESFYVGIALDPNDDYGEHTVEINSLGKYAHAQIFHQGNCAITNLRLTTPECL